MNAANAMNRFSMLLVAAIVVAASVLWWVGEVRAEARISPVGKTPIAPSVQDKKRSMDLDTKIFLHRNALIVTAAPTPPSV